MSQNSLFLIVQRGNLNNNVTMAMQQQPCTVVCNFKLLLSIYNPERKGEMQLINNSKKSQTLPSSFPLPPFLTTVGHIQHINNYIVCYTSFSSPCPFAGKPTRQTGRWQPLERLIPDVLVNRLQRICWGLITCFIPLTFEHLLISNNFFWGQQ